VNAKRDWVAPEPVSIEGTWAPDGMSRADVEALPQVKKLISANPALGEVVRRAEFWGNETCTYLEVVNVLGRWQSAEQLKQRTQFVDPDTLNMRVDSAEQAATLKRWQMAQKLGSIERMALLQNAKKLPFVDERLAASVGLTCEDFADIPVTDMATDVIYDAIAESKSGLIPYAVVDQRRATFFNEDGSVNLPAIKIGIAKASTIVMMSWFMFGKGNFVWILLIARGLADLRPDLFYFLNPASEEGKALWKAFAIL